MLGVQPSRSEVFQRLLINIAYNWSNVLSFGFANRQASESIAEDRINKPWRPIPTGRITSDQTRRVILILTPLTLRFNYCLGVWEQGMLIHIATWLYNNLREMDYPRVGGRICPQTAWPAAHICAINLSMDTRRATLTIRDWGPDVHRQLPPAPIILISLVDLGRLGGSPRLCR